jgi:hypothetical protein
MPRRNHPAESGNQSRLIEAVARLPRRPVLDGRIAVVDHDPAVQHDDVLAVIVAVEVERNLVRPFTEVLEPAGAGPAVDHELGAVRVAVPAEPRMVPVVRAVGGMADTVFDRDYPAPAGGAQRVCVSPG